MVGQEKFGQVLSVLSIILGAAGDEGFAEFLEGDGVDGIEGEPGIGFQEDQEMGGGLFETNGDAGLGVVVAWTRSFRRSYSPPAGAKGALRLPRRR